MQGRDHTIYALTEGYVKFAYNKLTRRRTIGVQLLPQQPAQQQRQEQTALKQVRLQLPWGKDVTNSENYCKACGQQPSSLDSHCNQSATSHGRRPTADPLNNDCSDCNTDCLQNHCYCHVVLSLVPGFWWNGSRHPTHWHATKLKFCWWAKPISNYRNPFQTTVTQSLENVSHCVDIDIVACQSAWAWASSVCNSYY